MLLHNSKTDKSHLDVTENAREKHHLRKMVNFSFQSKNAVQQIYRASKFIENFPMEKNRTTCVWLNNDDYDWYRYNHTDKTPNDFTCQIFSLFLIRTHKTKEKMITRFNGKFHVPKTFISFLVRKFLALGIMLGHFSWIFLLFVSKISDCNFISLCCLSIKQTSICIFLRLCEGHITIPTDSHQLQSHRLRLKFLMNTIFLKKKTKQQMKMKRMLITGNFLLHIYRERDTYVVWI